MPDEPIKLKLPDDPVRDLLSAEKDLFRAVACLTIDYPGPLIPPLADTSSIQGRLAAALQVLLIGVPPNYLPDDLRPQLDALGQAGRRIEGVGGEGSIAASARALKEPEAWGLAEDIILLYADVVRRRRKIERQEQRKGR